ncbi:MAG: hypothetical protein A2Z04_08890 [Chloroflexi bacterium RBG_16_57_9]|nr:MAG: hypothetical protein A2Z04_08890 [Chloroflexi bacterium RBG_16_57_9]
MERKRVILIMLGAALLAVLMAACGGASTPATSATQPAGAPPATRPQAVKGPRIAFESDTYDFGDMQFNKPAEYTFKFRNAGDAPLVIQGDPPVKAVQGC